MDISKFDKRIAILSDLHVGSVFGLLFPDFVTAAGHKIGLNVIQEALWEIFDWFVADMEKFNPHYIIINGDVVEGSQAKQRGTEASLIIRQDQEENAVLIMDVLRAAAPNAKFIFIQGTEYHDGLAGSCAESIAARVGATQYEGVGIGKYCKEELNMCLDGVTLHGAHHLGSFTGAALEKEVERMALAASIGKAHRADVIIRSHQHQCRAFTSSIGQIVLTPSWEAPTRFMRRRTGYPSPDIGGVFVTTNGQRKKNGEEPCKIERKIQTLPLPPLYKG